MPQLFRHGILFEPSGGWAREWMGWVGWAAWGGRQIFCILATCWKISTPRESSRHRVNRHGNDLNKHPSVAADPTGPPASKTKS